VTPTIWELLNDGDWACAHGDDEALERVALALADRLDGAGAQLAVRVAELATIDLLAATALWSSLCKSLREEINPSRSV
jgi:hypothetical protein